MPYSAPALEQGLWLRPRRVRSDRSQPFQVRRALVLLVVAGLIGFTGSALRVQVLDDTRAALSLAPAAPSSPRPAEQRYLAALRPIHAQLQQHVAQVGLGAAIYKSQDGSRAELKTRLDRGLAAYRQAETRMQALQPPPSLRAPHEGYLAAVRLFQQSTVEMLKMFDDDDEEHLASALPLSLEGATRLRELDSRLWPTMD